MMTGLSATALASEDSKKFQALLEKPLIVGASISGDFLTRSPGKVLALRYTNPSDIRVIATKGKPGKEVLKSVNAKTLSDRTSIIGVDLFFWDSFAQSPTQSISSLDNLISMAKEKSLPIILGEIPVLMPHMQPSAMVINNRLKDVCKSYEKCRLLPLTQILTRALEDGYIVQDGKKYSVEQLIPDSLHIAAPASEFLADEIKKLL